MRQLAFNKDCSFTLSWLPSGKPRIECVGLPKADVSIAHDDRTCLCVVGTGPVGCDWLPIMIRSREDWEALLGMARVPLLDQLVATGDDVDRAGARIWSATEAIRKATQAAEVALSLVNRQQDRVYLRRKPSPCSVGSYPAGAAYSPPLADDRAGCPRPQRRTL